MKRFRDKGAVGALLDEYEKAIIELQNVINTVTNDELIEIVDHNTENKDCLSIQSILAHVLRAGYGYTIEIRRHLKENISFVEGQIFISSEAYQIELKKMFDYNELLFEDYPNIEIEEKDNNKKMRVRWDQSYDIEQLFEHAIVHILRHRRQIERFLNQLRRGASPRGINTEKTFKFDASIGELNPQVRLNCVNLQLI